MFVRLLATVIAALLLIGVTPTASQSPAKTLAAPVSTAEISGAPVASAPTEPERLTAEEAKAIALAHAGLTADQVTELWAEFDVDNGIPEWDVDFRQGDWEFDYDIHAETGAIRHHNKEYDPADPVPTEPAPTEPAPTEPTPTEPERLTAEDAKAIALAHAGLTADQVRHLEVELDREDGIPVFEVDFDQKGWEYEYTIHAETGAILEWDKEFDD